MAPTTAPKKWLNASPGLLRAERPDYAYLKKVFQHTRILLSVKPTFRRSMKRRWGRSQRIKGPLVRSYRSFPCLTP